MTRFRILTISLVLLLITCLGYLLIDNIVQKNNQKALLAQIQVDRQRLAAIPAPDSSLTQLLVKAKSDNQRALAMATARSPGSTDVINSLLKLADQYSLIISPVSTESWTSISLASANYKMLPVEFAIQGYLPDLIAFIQYLEDVNFYPYLVIRGLNILDPLTTNDSNQDASSISVELKLAIIQRSESPDQGEH